MTGARTSHTVVGLPIWRAPTQTAGAETTGAATTVSLLGELRLVGPGGTADAALLPGPQPKTVFAYLLLHRGDGVPAGTLAEAVWGEDPPATWRPALRALVSKARRFAAAAAPSITVTAVSSGYVLDLQGPVDVDLERARGCAVLAERALARDDLDEAIEHAAGAAALAARPFLPRARSPWVDRICIELFDLRVRSLLVLGEVHVRRGEPDRGARAASEAIDVAPLHEASHRLLMRSLVAAGEVAEAAQAYARCRELLASELGMDPSPETTDLFTGILRR